MAKGQPKKAQRNAEIRKLRAEGKTLAEIGLLYGITRERVRQIVEKGVDGDGVAVVQDPTN